MDLVYRSALIKREAPISKGRVFTVIASTEDLDAHNTVVESSWILDRFLKNPVVLWDHNVHMTDCTLPIGTMRQIEVKEGALVGELVLASSAANPKSDQVYQSILEGTLRGVSVGFYPRDVRFEQRDGKEICVLSNNELMEISLTAVPSNPNALIQLRSRAKRKKKMEDEKPMESKREAPAISDTEKSVPYILEVVDTAEIADEIKASLKEALTAKITECLEAEKAMVPTEESRSVLAALGAKSSQAAIVAIEELRERSVKVGQLQQQIDKLQIDALCLQARRDGRLTPSLEAKQSWKRTVERGFDTVKEALELIDPVAMLRAPELPAVLSEGVTLTLEDHEILRRTGQDKDKFLAHKKLLNRGDR